MIDLGSVAPFGRISQSTSVYLPQDMQHRDNNSYISDVSIDFWMLSVVYMEKLFAIEIGGQKATPTTTKLLELLELDKINYLKKSTKFDEMVAKEDTGKVSI